MELYFNFMKTWNLNAISSVKCFLFQQFKTTNSLCTVSLVMANLGFQIVLTVIACCVKEINYKTFQTKN